MRDEGHKKDHERYGCSARIEAPARSRQWQKKPLRVGAVRPFRLPPIIADLGLKHRTRPTAPSNQMEQVRVSLIDCAITIAFPKFCEAGSFVERRPAEQIVLFGPRINCSLQEMDRLKVCNQLRRSVASRPPLVAYR
ncbi:hypothetical protein QA640_36760 [Bradyrhizobium sp. CB82]|uniref:hypothetical protein n=1 Tax=Bradyrhizobium sp. CB82 TaxID=3039159 RepID=UPI0024B085C1|nr:hypothetical protein [Bradyrhizobium sp. CB82]WFU39833.1 hypothetical protein QA640_36760 [Bradyrhizobium sp. CB82]